MLLPSCFLAVLVLMLILHRPRSWNRGLVSTGHQHATCEGPTGLHLAGNCDLTSKNSLKEISRNCSDVQTLVITKKADWPFPPCVLASGIVFLFTLVVLGRSQITTSTPIISAAPPLIHLQVPLDNPQAPLDHSQDPAVKWSLRFLLPFIEISQAFKASWN